jgi:catechol 2,3-dioxygenase-like lactoylglutathione lyase family enzyme
MTATDEDAAVPHWPNWLGLVVDDLEVARRFYGDVLGLEEVDAGEEWVQFAMGGSNVFELLQRSDLVQYDRRRFQPGFSVRDISLARRRLIDRGAEPITEIEVASDGGSSWCYFRDPEGNVFEVTQRGAPSSDDRDDAP